ncbi:MULTISPECIES: hypothetical protein [Thalassospira]|uniref:hypothetical protein n=1 Tax=Thalassospira TaxID=168934 RepID=UPI0012EC77E5|nr:hypothetical protein [Thalassospira permensis]
MKEKVINFDFVWIPMSVGGVSFSPFVNMRTSIRWQKYYEYFLSCSHDIQWEEVEFNENTYQGKALGRFNSDASLPIYFLEDGEPLEFLSGYKVLAVGILRKL